MHALFAAAVDRLVDLARLDPALAVDLAVLLLDPVAGDAASRPRARSGCAPIAAFHAPRRAGCRPAGGSARRTCRPCLGSAPGTSARTCGTSARSTHRHAATTTTRRKSACGTRRIARRWETGRGCVRRPGFGMRPSCLSRIFVDSASNSDFDLSPLLDFFRIYGWQPAPMPNLSAERPQERV